VQAIRPAVEPQAESRPDWEVFSALSILMGRPLDYADSRDILKEIRSLIPGYGALGPAPVLPKIDRAVVDRYLAGGYREDLSARYAMDAPSARPDGTVQLELVQSLFHSGKFSTRAKGLLQVEGGAALRISPADAARFALADGDRVRLSNSRGELTTAVKIVPRVPEGQAWFPDHFAQAAMPLFECSIDPVTRVPAFRTTTVSLMKVA
jgi:formate dehydrogenase alpha subunit